MPVVINEIVTEVVVAQPHDVERAPGEPRTDSDIEVIVRRAAERVLEIIRREWDR